eukprot:CCRYP_012702-RA/>CCRYP_012702-RA protein AED:0.39 eAED:0.45 QI:0/0/0/1/1/1/2/0/172
MAHSIRYLHAVLGFPTKNTLLAAIRNGNLTTFPGLTSANITKHFPESDETQKGITVHQTQNYLSSIHTYAWPQTRRDAYLCVYDAMKKTMYTDQTSRFPVISGRGHKYVMVAIELDGNYIETECMKSRRTNNLIKAYQNIHQCWKDSQVIHVNWHILDNEAPCELKATLHSN